MLAYFKDTSAKILRVQVSNYTDVIPQDTSCESPRKRPLVAEPRGGPLTTAQSAAPAAPKQRQKCMRQRKRYTHIAPPPSTRLSHGFGAASAFACTGGAARPLGSPVPPRHHHAVAAAQHTESRGGGAGRVVRPAASFARRASSRSPARHDATRRAGRRARSPRMTTSRGTPSRRGC